MFPYTEVVLFALFSAFTVVRITSCKLAQFRGFPVHLETLFGGCVCVGGDVKPNRSTVAKGL